MSDWFTLPLPFPDPTRQPDESSSSDPDWLLNQNFRNRIHFEPWGIFEREVKSVQDDLARLSKNDEHKKNILSLLTPVSNDLKNEGWRYCWNESTVDRQISVQVWRAVNKARSAVMALGNRQSDFPEIFFVSQNQVKSEQYVKRVAKDLGISMSISNPEHIIPDVCCFSKGSDSRGDKSPLATIELKGSRARFIQKLRDGSSARKVADYCTSVFTKRPQSRVLGVDFNITKRLSQALTQAFHTESGAGALYNHTHALFFYIEGKENLAKGKTRVVVRISRLYQCDTVPSNLHAFTAWSFLIEELSCLRKNASRRKKQLLDAIEFVSTSSKEHEDDDDNPPTPGSNEPTSSQSSPSRGSLSPKRKKRKGSDNQKGSKKSTGASSSSRDAKPTHEPFDGDLIISHKKALSQARVASFETFISCSSIDNAEDICDRFRNDDIIKLAMKSDIEILGEGTFGFVRKAFINGVVAAMKYGNRRVGAAQHYLHNEMLMYCYIASRFPHLLNCSVPDLLAIGFDDWAGPVLITKMVGEDVSLQDGLLIVGKERLKPELALLVCAYALKCLQCLHQCGIVHRDLALRNLRACMYQAPASDANSSYGKRCAAWWIDLGLSKIGGSKEEFVFEMEQCVSLFPTHPRSASDTSPVQLGMLATV